MGRTVSAKLKYLRLSPRKVGLVASLIRGKQVGVGKDLLKFTPKRAAAPLLKVLESAVANAKQSYNLAEDALRIKRILVGPGPTLKRGRPVSRGRWHSVLKRSTHVTIELEEIKGIQKSRPKAGPPRAKKIKNGSGESGFKKGIA